MVQFELKLEENIIEKWRDKYLDYVRLKKIIKEQTKSKETKFKSSSSQQGLSAASAGESSGLLTSPSSRGLPRSLSADQLLEMSDMSSSRASLEEGSNPAISTLDAHLRPSGLFEVALQQQIHKFTQFYRVMLDAFVVELEKYEAEQLDRKTSDEFPSYQAVQSIDLEEPSWDQPTSPTSSPRAGDSKQLKRSQSLGREPRTTHTRSIIRRTRHSMRRALQTLYREMLLINNFAILNFTGVIKITKKAKKQLGSAEVVTLGPDGTPQCVQRPPLPELANVWMEQHKFNEGQDVRLLLKRVEQLYAQWFSDGNLHVATGELLSQVTEETISYDMLKLGYRLGVACTFGLWMTWDCLILGLKAGGPSLEEMPAFPVLCGLGGLLSVHWSWAIQVMVWTRYKINYIYLFELDPRYVRGHIKIINDCIVDTIIFLMLTMLYFKAMLRHLPYPVKRPGTFILFGIAIAAYRLIFPWQNRRHLWTTLFRVVFCFCNEPVNFFDTYVGDVLTSMVKIFLDVAFTVGFVCSGDVLLEGKESRHAGMEWRFNFWYRNIACPLVVFLPLFWRFLQCLSRYGATGQRWPHLGNAVKYGAAQLITIFGAIHPLYSTLAASLGYQVFWLSLFICSTLLSFGWDVLVDWGLGWFALNDRQMYPHRGYYYAAVVLDLFLRFLWVYSLIPPAADELSIVSLLVTWITPLSLLLEMVRRTIWGFFRLENEHLRNTEGFRRVSVVPLHYQKLEDDQAPVGKNVVWEVIGFGVLILGLGACALVVSSWELNGWLPDTDDGPSPMHNHTRHGDAANATHMAHLLL